MEPQDYVSPFLMWYQLWWYFLWYYLLLILSQGSVSIPLTLVYPWCGIYKGRPEYNCISYLYVNVYVDVFILTFLDICLGVVYCHCLCIHVCVHVLFIGLARMHEDMLFYRGCVTHRNIQVFRFFRWIWCLLWIRSIWPTLYFIGP